MENFMPLNYFTIKFLKINFQFLYFQYFLGSLYNLVNFKEYSLLGVGVGFVLGGKVRGGPG